MRRTSAISGSRKAPLRVGQWALLAILVSLFGAGHSAAGSDWTWSEQDWSGGQYAFAERIDPEIRPGWLVLENRPEEMLFVGEPTDFLGIFAMAVYHDTLYLGASDYPISVDGADIIAYDEAADTFSLAYQPYEQGLVALKVYGDTLYVPGPDSQGSWDWGNIYLFGGSSWIRKETVPSAVHVFDLAVLDGTIWVTGGHRQSTGLVWRSDDWGDTFQEAFVIPYSGVGVRRFYGCEAFQGRLFFQQDGRGDDEFLLRFDGSVWDSLAIPDHPVDRQGLFTAWGDSLLFTIGNRMYVLDGDQVIERWMPFQGNTWCRSVHIFRDTLYGGAQNGLLYRWHPETNWSSVGQLGLDPSTEEIEALATHHGRLYAATSRTGAEYGGRLYVSAAESSGRLISSVHDFGGPSGNGILSWEAFEPAGGSGVRFQVRCSYTLAELEGRAFLGPDGTSESYFETSPAALPENHQGGRFFQYAVELQCPDGLRMPWLENVSLGVDSLAASAVEESDPYQGPSNDPPIAGQLVACLHLAAPLPNPASDRVEFHLSLLEGTVVLRGAAGGATGITGREIGCLRVIDIQGREVRAARIPLEQGRSGVWQWDLRDQCGRRVPAGIYQVRADLLGRDAHLAICRSFVLLR